MPVSKKRKKQKKDQRKTSEACEQQSQSWREVKGGGGKSGRYQSVPRQIEKKYWRQ